MRNCIEEVEIGQPISGQSLMEFISNGGYQVKIFYKDECYTVDDLPLSEDIKGIFTAFQTFIRIADGITDFDDKSDWRDFLYHRTTSVHHRNFHGEMTYEDYLETNKRFEIFLKATKK